MAENDEERTEPSLELPSLRRFGRRRKERVVEEPAPEPEAVTEPVVVEPEALTEPVVVEPETEPEPVAVEPEPEPEPEPAAAPPTTTRRLPALGRWRRRTETPEPVAELPADEAETEVFLPVDQTPPVVVVDEDDIDGAEEPDAPGAVAGPQGESAKPKRRPVDLASMATLRLPPLPPVAPRLAAALTGVAVGLLTVLLTIGALNGCRLVRGTSSCGSIGYLVILAIVLAGFLLGAALLRSWSQPDPASTSLLAVAVMCVVLMLLLVDVLTSWWMLLVVPVVAAASFVGSHAITTTFGTEASTADDEERAEAPMPR